MTHQNNSAEGESCWETTWYIPNDTLLVRYWGEVSDEAMSASADALTTKFDEAEGDLLIYVIADMLQITAYSPQIMVTAALHRGSFHPRAGKLYVVTTNSDLIGMNNSLNIRRPDSVRIMDTVAEAAADIAKRRAAYQQRQALTEKKLAASPLRELSEDAGRWETAWYIPNDTLIVRYYGFLSHQVLTEGLDDLTRKFDEAEGDLRIYTISDERGVTGYDEDILVTAALHHGFFHPRAGKLYVVGNNPQLIALSHLLNDRRFDSVRMAPSVEEAAADITKRRQAYLNRLKGTDS